MTLISVNKKLPDIGKNNSKSFLCLCENSYYLLLSFITDDKGKGKFYFNYKNIFKDYTKEVTHWCNLPETNNPIEETAFENFEVVCKRCGSYMIEKEDSRGYSRKSGKWGSLDLVCVDCENREIIDE